MMQIGRGSATSNGATAGTWRDRVGAMPQLGRVASMFAFGALTYPLVGRLLPGGDDRYGSPIAAVVSGILFGTMLAFFSEYLGRRELRAFDARPVEERQAICRSLRTGHPVVAAEATGVLSAMASRRRDQVRFSTPVAIAAGLLAAVWLVTGITRSSLVDVVWGVVAGAFAAMTFWRGRRAAARLDSLHQAMRARELRAANHAGGS